MLNSVSLSPTLSHLRRPILLMHMTALWRQPFSGSSVPSKCEVQERTLLKRTTYNSFSSWLFPPSWLILIFLWEHESRPFWVFLYFLRVFFTSCYAFSYWKVGVGTCLMHALIWMHAAHRKARNALAILPNCGLVVVYVGYFGCYTSFPSLISLMVSMDVKHHVCLLAYFTLLCSLWEIRVGLLG